MQKARGPTLPEGHSRSTACRHTVSADNVFDSDRPCRGPENSRPPREQVFAQRTESNLAIRPAPHEKQLQRTRVREFLIRACETGLTQEPPPCGGIPPDRISKITFRVVVFQDRLLSHLCYASKVISQCRTRVKHLLSGTNVCATTPQNSRLGKYEGLYCADRPRPPGSYKSYITFISPLEPIQD